jgi:hypothetical protein
LNRNRFGYSCPIERRVRALPRNALLAPGGGARVSFVSAERAEALGGGRKGKVSALKFCCLTTLEMPWAKQPNLLPVMLRQKKVASVF